MEFPQPPEILPKKLKNRKWHTNFFVFDYFFFNFELVSIDLESNSALGNQTYLYQKCGRGTQKSNETRNLKIPVKITKKKKNFDRKAPDGEAVGPKSLHIQNLRIHGSSIGQNRFSF